LGEKVREDVPERWAKFIHCCDDRQDHIDATLGDQLKSLLPASFSPLWCRLHHESDKNREDARGYSTSVSGADGCPVDPRHRWVVWNFF
jgi:hypothetical protein